MPQAKTTSEIPADARQSVHQCPTATGWLIMRMTLVTAPIAATAPNATGGHGLDLQRPVLPMNSRTISAA